MNFTAFTVSLIDPGTIAPDTIKLIYVFINM